MLMNYDNTIMEILQKITISAVVVLMNCDKLTIKGKITGKKQSNRNEKACVTAVT